MSSSNLRVLPEDKERVRALLRSAINDSGLGSSNRQPSTSNTNPVPVDSGNETTETANVFHSITQSLLGNISFEKCQRQITAESAVNFESDEGASEKFLNELKAVWADKNKKYSCPYRAARNGQCANVSLAYQEMVVHLWQRHELNFGFTCKSLNTTLRVAHHNNVPECDSCKARLGDSVTALEHARHHVPRTPPYECDRCKVQLYGFQLSEHAQVTNLHGSCKNPGNFN